LLKLKQLGVPVGFRISAQEGIKNAKLKLI
jgi:hypothetical protein